MASETLQPGFWQVGAWRGNVRRIKDGVEELDDFGKMVRERAEIEAKYGRTLQQFGEKWRAHVERNVYAGATKEAWLDLLGESDALALQHQRVKDRLNEEISKTLSLFRKENHHPSAFRAPKEIRETEEAFEKAQRQWKKLFDKLESAKKAYYQACRAEKTTHVMLSNCQADTAVSQDGAQKFRDRHEKAKEDVEKTRVAYEKQIAEIIQYKTPYVENMTFVFEKCQQMELKRLKFIVEMIGGVQQVLADLIRNQKVSQLHTSLEESVKRKDEGVLQSDLRNWSAVYGTESHMEWPAFEEYTTEMRQIAKRETAPAPGAGGVILTRQIIKSEEISVPRPLQTSTQHNRRDEVAGPASGGSDGAKSSASSDSSTLPRAPHLHDESLNQHWNDADSPPPSSTTPDSAKYGGFDEYVTKGQATVLYDYKPIEQDEIELKKGDVIELLSEPDSLGWCTGRKDNVTGLFPASYVQAI